MSPVKAPERLSTPYPCIYSLNVHPRSQTECNVLHHQSSQHHKAHLVRSKATFLSATSTTAKSTSFSCVIRIQSKAAFVFLRCLIVFQGTAQLASQAETFSPPAIGSLDRANSSRNVIAEESMPPFHSTEGACSIRQRRSMLQPRSHQRNKRLHSSKSRIHTIIYPLIDLHAHSLLSSSRTQHKMCPTEGRFSPAHPA